MLAGCSDLGTRESTTAQTEVSVLAIDFGSVTVSDSARRTVVLRNVGRADAFGAVSVSCPGFRVASGGGSFQLAPRRSREVAVVFRPPSAGTFACSLDLGNEFPSVSLAGAGALQSSGAHCQLSTNAIDFGPVGVGKSAIASLDVSNTGTAPLVVNVVSPCSDFLVIQGGGATTIAPGDAITVKVLFNPLDGGALACTLDVGPGCPTVSLAGFPRPFRTLQDIAPSSTRAATACPCGAVTVSRSSDCTSAPGDTARSEIIAGSRVARHHACPSTACSTYPFQISKFVSWILEGALNN